MDDNTDTTTNPPLNRRIIGVADWEKKLISVAKIRKQDMNKLVMDFLSTTTVRNVAEKFREESGTEIVRIKVGYGIQSVSVLPAIVEAIKSGDVEKACVYLNTYFPKLRQTEPHICFQMDQQRVIEQIRHNKLEGALWLYGYLREWNKISERYYKDIVQTSFLMNYSNPSSCQYAYLMDKSKRLALANLLEQAVLRRQTRAKDPTIHDLLDLLYRIQNDLDAHVDYPRLFHNSLTTLEEEFTKLRI